ncbi:MAG: hypothetical protein JXA06_13450 [Bacteroidetes bacterium]|nr:hypothetical protein [Bacteroidota bacterium]
MPYTYEQLSKLNVTELRKIADGIEHEALHGHSTMHKEKLLPALCKALNIEGHAHHTVIGINKSGMKAEIKKWKRERAAAVAGKDYVKLAEIRQHIHNLKGKLRRSIV